MSVCSAAASPPSAGAHAGASFQASSKSGTAVSAPSSADGALGVYVSSPSAPRASGAALAASGRAMPPFAASGTAASE